jgi:glycosyltransferase involved in cell wall biosynthesis
VGEQLAISEYVAQSIGGLSIVVRPGVSDIADPPPLDIRGSVVLVLRHLAPDRHTKVTIEKVVGSDFADLGWRLEIAGPGEVESEMREPTDRSGFRESCQFVGQSFNVGARYRRALIFFAPRPNEPYDLALLEAVNYGLPVVARRGGGHVETVGSVAVTSFSASGDLDTAAGMLEEPATDPTLWTQYGGELSWVQLEKLTIASRLGAAIVACRRLITWLQPSMIDYTWFSCSLDAIGAEVSNASFGN